MLAPLAEFESLAERLGLSLDAESTNGARAAALLEDASALIRSEAGKDWLDDGGDVADVPSIVESICLHVAMRAFRNPDGLTQATVGDTSVSYGRALGVNGAVYLTKAELRQIRRAAGVAAPSSVVLESPFPVGRSAHSSEYYRPVNNGGDPILMGPAPWET